MSIHLTSGQRVVIERLGLAADIRDLTGTEPLDADFANIRAEQLVIVRLETGERRIIHRAFLRSSECLLREIDEAVEAARLGSRARAEAFLGDLEAVCRRHGLALCTTGAFRVQLLDEELIGWLRDALVDGKVGG
jgi:hypothetical protein